MRPPSRTWIPFSKFPPPQTPLGRQMSSQTLTTWITDYFSSYCNTWTCCGLGIGLLRPRDRLCGLSIRRVSVAFALSPRLLVSPSNPLLSHLKRHAERQPSLADATSTAVNPMSRATCTTARSRVPVRIHALAGDTIIPFIESLRTPSYVLLFPFCLRTLPPA